MALIPEHNNIMVCRVVRLTSPNLNYFIIAGSYIMYATTFIRLIRSTDFTANYVRCNVSLLRKTINSAGSLIMFTNSYSCF